MQNDMDFYSLSSREQILELESAFNTVSQKIYDEKNAEILAGEIEIADISYNTTKDGTAIYCITIINTKTKEETYEYFTKDLEELDISLDTIAAYKALGSDTTEMEEELKELEGLKDSPSRVSLSELKSMDKDLDEVSTSLGLSREEIATSVKIDSDHKVKIDEKQLNGESISAQEKVSTHYNLKDVLGGDYTSYQIIKLTNGNYKLMGITQDGFAEEIMQDKVELITDPQTISLTQESGESKEANMIVGFRVKSRLSDVDNDQIVGLCDDGRSQMTAFYGRGAISQDKIVAENIPSKTYNGYRARQEKYMDTRITDMQEFGEVNEYISEVAEGVGVDEETLRDEVIKAFPDYDGITRDEVYEIASDLARTEPLPPEHTLEPNDNPENS